MRYLLSILFISSTLIASELEYKGNIGIDIKKYNYNISFLKQKTQKTIEANIELKKTYEEVVLFTKIESIKDIDKSTRKYLKLNEFYLKYEADNYDIKIGRDIKYWGAMELYNITDIYNKKNTQYNENDKDAKLGTDGFTYNYYLQNEDSISVIISKNKDAKNNISSFLKYSGSRDDIASRDFSYILSSFDESFLMFHTLIIKDSIYKVEYLYLNKTKTYKTAIGIEHTLYGINDKKDLSIMLEYYKSNNKNTIYQNNIFLGSRLTFNDTKSSDLTIGLIKDNSKDEYSKSIEFNTRIYDEFKTKLSYISNENVSIYNINIAYHF